MFRSPDPSAGDKVSRIAHRSSGDQACGKIGRKMRRNYLVLRLASEINSGAGERKKGL